MDFQISRTMKDVFGARLAVDRAEEFARFASAGRFDEVLGPWKPSKDVICDATSHAARPTGIEYYASDGERLYEAIGSWGRIPTSRRRSTRWRAASRS